MWIIEKKNDMKIFPHELKLKTKENWQRMKITQVFQITLTGKGDKQIFGYWGPFSSPQ